MASAADRGKLGIAVFDMAAGEARRLRQNWLGPEHYLLAVLAEPSIATETMAELGVTHDRLATEFGRVMKNVNGRRVRYIESKGITTNPAAHGVSGWAKGFAAASGRERAIPEDWLLSVVYYDHGDVVGSALHGLGVSAAAVVGGHSTPRTQDTRLRTRGASTLARSSHDRGRQVRVASRG